MKLIDKWRDTDYKVSNSIFELTSGLNVIHTLNKRSNEFNFSVVLKGGSFYERQAGVPQGTAHFLEHILFSSPNKVFKSREEMDHYAFGNKSRPSLGSNASTSRRFIYFYAHANKKAENRILNLIISRIDFPLENIENTIEKERKIILGEVQRKLKEDKDSGLQYEKFMWGDILPEFAENVIGTEESITKITADDLRKYYNRIFNTVNTVVSIQSPSKISKTTLKHLNKLDNILRKDNVIELQDRPEKVSQNFRFKHFFEERNTGVFFSMSFFYTLKKKIDYKEDKLYVLLNNLFYKLAHEYLREEKHLIYDCDTFNFNPAFIEKCRGFKMSCELKNFQETLDETYTMLYEYAEKFLNSELGTRWFQSIISSQLFKTNNSEDADYAESLAVDYQDQSPYMKFDYTKSKKETLKLTKDDMIKFFKEFLTIEPAFWFVSGYEEKEVINIFKKSKFYKKFENIDRKVPKI